MTWLTRQEAAQRLRISVATFARGVREGRLPSGRAVGVRRKVWSERELDEAVSGSSADPIMDVLRRA